jgi:hypothetical protein
VRDCIVSNNSVTWATVCAGVGLWCASGTVEGCAVVGNQATGIGGECAGVGAYCGPGGTVRNSVVSGNGVPSCSVGRGGGICCEGGVVRECVVSGNSVRAADMFGGWGGGVYCSNGGIVRNCLISGNWVDAVVAPGGGGGCHVYGSGAVQNCTIAYNAVVGAVAGVGGAHYEAGGTLENSIVYFNTPDNCGSSGSPAPAVTNCCTVPDFVAPGVTNAPCFVNPPAGDYRLRADSACINAGTNRPWMTGATDLGGVARIAAGRVDIGAYEYLSTTHYVWPAGSNVWPYASWGEAATNIQAAVDVALDGHLVLVAFGVYPLSSAVVVSNAVTIRGVDGAAATVVDGGNATRCFVLSDSNAVLEDLTITRGTAGNGAVPAGLARIFHTRARRVNGEVLFLGEWYVGEGEGAVRRCEASCRRARKALGAVRGAWEGCAVRHRGYGSVCAVKGRGREAERLGGWGR